MCMGHGLFGGYDILAGSSLQHVFFDSILCIGKGTLLRIAKNAVKVLVKNAEYHRKVDSLMTEMLMPMYGVYQNKRF